MQPPFRTHQNCMPLTRTVCLSPESCASHQNRVPLTRIVCLSPESCASHQNSVPLTRIVRLPAAKRVASVPFWLRVLKNTVLCRCAPRVRKRMRACVCVCVCVSAHVGRHRFYAHGCIHSVQITALTKRKCDEGKVTKVKVTRKRCHAARLARHTPCPTHTINPRARTSSSSITGKHARACVHVCACVLVYVRVCTHMYACAYALARASREPQSPRSLLLGPLLRAAAAGATAFWGCTDD